MEGRAHAPRGAHATAMASRSASLHRSRLQLALHRPSGHTGTGGPRPPPAALHSETLTLSHIPLTQSIEIYSGIERYPKRRARCRMCATSCRPP